LRRVARQQPWNPKGQSAFFAIGPAITFSGQNPEDWQIAIFGIALQRSHVRTPPCRFDTVERNMARSREPCLSAINSQVDKHATNLQIGFLETI
jgi:hypothetical protein